MRESRRQDVIIFEDRPIVLPAILAVMSLVFAVNLALQGAALLGGEKEAIGTLLGALFCAFGAVFLFRRDRFAFDVARRQLRWRKWSIVGSTSGEIDFDGIVDVTMESMNRSEGGGIYRVALRTPDGTLPLTETYSGQADDWRPIVGRIRDILGLDSEQSANSDTEAHLAQGRKTDAIRQLRETEDLDLTDARATVEIAASHQD